MNGLHSPEQLIDLFSVNAKTGVPTLSLSTKDLEIVDDGKVVPTANVLRPGQPGIRPVVLWIIVQCAMPGVVDDGSGFLRGFTADLASGLMRLQSGDTYGIAHWCDDGTSAIDLAPNRHITQAGPILSKLLNSPVNPPTNPFPGETALFKVIRDTVAATAGSKPDAAPVLLFFYGDHSAANARAVATITDELLRIPAIVFLVNDGLENPPRADFREVPSVISHLASDTGGFAFHPPFNDHDPLKYAQSIATILEVLHSRYQLSWLPRHQDGYNHPLAVRLSPDARKAYSSITLHFRTSYVAIPPPVPPRPQH